MNIIITGASRGIGLALAKAYARPGVRLGLVARHADRLAAAAAACRALGADVEVAALDVSADGPLAAWLVAFDRRHPVDLLVANAGVTSVMPGNGDNEDWQRLRQVVDTNIIGVLNSVYPLLAPMRQRRRGQLALISSLAAYRGLPICPSYCASKAAVLAYGQGLGGWLRCDGVRVSVVCPGFVQSELSDAFTAPKLFMMSADRAARVIKRGLAARRAVIDFPWPLALGMRMLALLPARLADGLLSALGYGPGGRAGGG